MVARGVYVVKEDGLQFDHSSMNDQPTTSCSTAEEYLIQFRYVTEYHYSFCVFHLADSIKVNMICSSVYFFIFCVRLIRDDFQNQKKRQ